jgi:hypothetical protein
VNSNGGRGLAEIPNLHIGSKKVPVLLEDYRTDERAMGDVTVFCLA